VDMRFVKPLDETKLKELADNHSLFVTVEENAVKGGAGSAVNEFLESESIEVQVLNIGLPDAFIDHGKPEEMLSACGLDSQGILKSIRERLA